MINDNLEKLNFYAADILTSPQMLSEKQFLQHGGVSCYEHSVNVAKRSLAIAEAFSLTVDERSMIRGALLHDYFLYDWHSKDHPRLHGIYHAEKALRNASAEFSLNAKEKNIIRRHMFPLNLCPPRYREAWIVCLSDKLCAMDETLTALHAFQAVRRFFSARR